MSLRSNRFLRTLYYRYTCFREHRSYTSGKNNRIENRGIRVCSRIQIIGNNNSVEIEPEALIKEVRIRIQGENNRILIRRNAYLAGTELWIEDNGCLLEIGERSFVGRSHLAVTENDRKLVIGSDCMLSSNVQIRTGDSHSILSISPSLRINSAQDVRIEDHVWIGEGAKIMKGVVLDRDVIVASGAVVTSSFEKNQLVGGTPAKVLKQCVTWDRQRL